VADYYDARKGRRRDYAVTGGVLLLAVILIFIPVTFQSPIRSAVQSTVLRPFIAAQEGLAARRSEGVDVSELRAQRDSLSALVAAESSLSEENRRLRGLMGLHGRVSSDFLPAEVVRLGTAGAESTFLLDHGRAEGVQVGSPVISAGGLLGVVWEVSDQTAQAIDWTHPDFRASAMTADGEVYGIVEARRGRFREEDMLALTGAPFHSDLPNGTRVVTSGRGGLYPRGIPLGVVVGIEEADTGWRKSYLLRPALRPEGVSHVLVGVKNTRTDMSELWQVAAPPDTATLPDDTTAAGRRARAEAAARPQQRSTQPVNSDTAPRLLGTPVAPQGNR
jgi:rod shape-determining protein MreC